jgi:hypothetical protein
MGFLAAGRVWYFPAIHPPGTRPCKSPRKKPNAPRDKISSLLRGSRACRWCSEQSSVPAPASVSSGRLASVAEAAAERVPPRHRPLSRRRRPVNLPSSSLRRRRRYQATMAGSRPFRPMPPRWSPDRFRPPRASLNRHMRCATKAGENPWHRPRAQRLSIAIPPGRRRSRNPNPRSRWPHRRHRTDGHRDSHHPAAFPARAMSRSGWHPPRRRRSTPKSHPIQPTSRRPPMRSPTRPLSRPGPRCRRATRPRRRFKPRDRRWQRRLHRLEMNFSPPLRLTSPHRQTWLLRPRTLQRRWSPPGSRQRSTGI